MKKLSVFFITFALAVFLFGCVSIHSVGVSNVAPNEGTVKTAEASGFGVLTLTVPDAASLEKQAIANLKAKGATKNIIIRLQMRNFFIVQQYVVIATGE